MEKMATAKYKESLERIYNYTDEKVRELSTDIVQYQLTTTPENAPDNTNSVENLSIIIILCFFSVVGTLGNGLVLYVFTRARGKLTSTIFILALAGTDFVTCLIIIPYTVITIHFNYYVGYDILCKLYQFLITCTVPLSAFIMVAIAVDRYICICHPFTHFMTVRRAKYIVGILTAFAVVLGLITSLGFSIYGIEIKEVETSSNLTSPISEVIFSTNATDDRWPGEGANGANNEYHLTKKTQTKELVAGQCQQSPILFSIEFIEIYQKIYSAFYLCSLLIVLILYSLIYSSVTRQRAKRRAQKMANRVKQVNTQSQTDESTMPLTSIVNNKHNTNNTHNNLDTKVELDGETVCTKLSVSENGNNPTLTSSENQPIKSTSSIRRHGNGEQHRDRRDHDRLANIKTAVMLFIVTIVFIIAFLPAWLMAHQWLTFNIVVFYMYFVYNVANPVIYAFLNQLFRENMCRMFSSCRMYFNTSTNNNRR